MNYRLVTDPTEIREYIGDARVVAFDFETAPTEEWRGEEMAALDAHKAEITGVSLSVKAGTGIYVPLRHAGGGNAEAGSVIPVLRDMVWENENVVKAAHNLAFEAMFLYAHGIVLREPVYDTIAAAQMTKKDPWTFRELKDSGLKKLVPEILGVSLPTFSEVTGGRFFDELPADDPETIRYACADSDYALQLYERFNEWFEQYLPRHRWIVEHVESPAAVYAGIMKYNGLPADRDAMIRMQSVCCGWIVRLQNRIRKFTGKVDIGANCGTKAFKDFLYKTLGLPVLKTTESSAEAADDQAMQMLAAWCTEHRPELAGLFGAVQEYRQMNKLKTTYVDGYLKCINGATGRIHPDLMPLATETGRFACRNPNCQNMPRKTNDPVGVRSFIKAGEGQVLVSCDMSQIELRIGAFYCRDERMLEVYRTGGDIHAQTTSIIYGIPYEQAKDKHAPDYKERRTIAKGVNFGLFFGLYPKGLQQQLTYKAGLKPTLAECMMILDRIRAGYPQLGLWQERTKNRARRNCYTETFLGRRRYLPGIESEDWKRRSQAERCALNTPIQGTAAEILKTAMGRVLAGLPDRPWLRPILQIHDELVFEIPEERLEEAVGFIRECMEAQPFPELDVPLAAEASYGPDFGHMKEWSDER